MGQTRRSRLISQGGANEDLAKTPSIELMPNDPNRNIHSNFKGLMNP